MRSQQQDPFEVARVEVEAAVKKVQFMHKEWRRLLEQSNTAENRQFKDLQEEIRGELQMLDYDLKEVSRSIQTVEQNRERFHLSDADLAVRNAFVKRCREAHQEMESEMNGSRAQAKMEEDRRQALVGNRQREQQEQQRRSALSAQANAQGFFAQEQLLQRQLINQQEDELVELSKATQRVGQVAQTLNGELQTQAKMLEELNDDIDEQASRMGVLMKGVSSVLKTSNKWQIYGLTGLVLFFVVEVWLIFNT